MTGVLEQLRNAGPDPALESQAIGEWLLEAAGVERPPGLVTAAMRPEAERVPWARRADWIIVPSAQGLALASLSPAAVEPGENLAGEERDRVNPAALKPEAQLNLEPEALLRRGALVRAALMAGALERICQLSLAHARERQQFGRAIGFFQAVQAHLVTIAQQTALVSVAVDGATTRAGGFEIAAAKLLAGRAAVTATRAAHQVHGAIGVTRAHPLGADTRRLWAWRGEYGDERLWAARLGGGVGDAGPDRLYRVIAGGSQEVEI
jgi:acyl-CoA dehydrogenase